MKKTSLFIVLVISVFSVSSQVVNIPDPNFKNCLLSNSGINTNMDNEIQLSEASAFNGQIFCIAQGISDLTGIEAFVNLRVLICPENQISQLDLSANTALVELKCQSNQISSLNVSNNLALEELYCHANQITSLDVSNNIALQELYCHANQITSLDVSNNIALERLRCEVNQISDLDVSNTIALERLSCHTNQICTLDVSNNIALERLICYANELTSLNVANNFNTNFTQFNAINNPELTCIQIDAGFTPPSFWEKDATASYDTSCCYIETCSLEEVCGTLTDAYECPIENLTLQYPVESTGCDGQQYITAQTDTEGNFCISVPKDGCARLEIQNCDDLCEDPIGISDLVLLLRYLLGYDVSEDVTPYIQVFGNVKSDINPNLLAASDLLEIRKHLLGIPSSTSNVGDCIIFNPDDITLISSNRYSGNLNSVICDADDNLSLIAGIMGDIDGSCSPCSGNKPEIVTTSPVIRMSKNGAYNSFYFDEDITFHELFLEFELNEIVLPEAVIIENGNANYLKHVDGDTVKIAMYGVNGVPVSFNANQNLISITTDLNSSINLNEANSNIVTSSWEIGSVEFNRDIARKLDASQSSSVLLYTNENTLNLKLLNDLEDVTIQVFDINGNELQNAYYSSLRTGDLKTFNSSRYSGIYFVVIDSKQTKEVHKIVF